MAKKAKVWDGSAWQDLVNATQDLTPYSTTAQMNTAIAASAGLTQVIPTSIAKGASGTASATAGGTVTFTGTESLSLNGVFTTNYDNYQIIFYADNSANDAINVRFRTGGTDNTSTSYKYQFIRGYSTTVNGVDSASSTFAPFYSTRSTSYKSIITGTVGTPAQSEITTFTATQGTLDFVMVTGANFDATTSFDGITFLPPSGLITGKVAIYAYARG